MKRNILHYLFRWFLFSILSFSIWSPVANGETAVSLGGFSIDELNHGRIYCEACGLAKKNEKNPIIRKQQALASAKVALAGALCDRIKGMMAAYRISTSDQHFKRSVAQIKTVCDDPQTLAGFKIIMNENHHFGPQYEPSTGPYSFTRACLHGFVPMSPLLKAIPKFLRMEASLFENQQKQQESGLSKLREKVEALDKLIKERDVSQKLKGRLKAFSKKLSDLSKSSQLLNQTHQQLQQVEKEIKILKEKKITPVSHNSDAMEEIKESEIRLGKKIEELYQALSKKEELISGLMKDQDHLKVQMDRLNHITTKIENPDSNKDDLTTGLKKDQTFITQELDRLRKMIIESKNTTISRNDSITNLRTKQFRLEKKLDRLTQTMTEFGNNHASLKEEDITTLNKNQHDLAAKLMQLTRTIAVNEDDSILKGKVIAKLQKQQDQISSKIDPLNQTNMEDSIIKLEKSQEELREGQQQMAHDIEKFQIEFEQLVQSVTKKESDEKKLPEILNPSSIFSGLIVKACGLGFVPGQYIRLYSNDGEEGSYLPVYTEVTVDESIINKGTADIADSLEKAYENERIWTFFNEGQETYINPLVIEALGAEKSNLLVGFKERQLLNKLSKTQTFLRDGKVVVVMENCE